MEPWGESAGGKAKGNNEEGRVARKEHEGVTVDTEHVQVSKTRRE